MQVKIGGIQGQHLYVLNYFTGVSVLTIWQTKDALKCDVESRLGTIRVERGFKFDQYNDQSLLILAKTESSHKFALTDISFDIGKALWFVLNEHAIPGQANDVDIAKRIAVIKGVDSHHVVFHSVYREFSKHQEVFEFYASNLIKLDLFEASLAQQSKWHYN